MASGRFASDRALDDVGVDLDATVIEEGQARSTG
jgi:hypothetical protein